MAVRVVGPNDIVRFPARKFGRGRGRAVGGFGTFSNGQCVDDEISPGRSVEDGTVDEALKRIEDAGLSLNRPVDPEASVPPLPLSRD